MKLYLKSLGISVKYTFKVAVLPFVVLLLCVAIALVALPQEKEQSSLAIGIRLLDTHPMVPLVARAVLSSPELKEFAELHLLAPDEPEEGLAAVITLPQGFTASILSGENLSPTVMLGSTGISSIYIRELCTAVERYLSSAQAGIYATLAAVEQLPPEQYSRVITDINLSYASLFLNRQSILSKEFSSFDSFYLLRCATAVLLFLLGGALGGAVPPLLATARSMRGVRGSALSLFAGAGSGILLFCLPVTLLCLTAAFGMQVWQQPVAAVLVAVLLSGVSLFFSVAVGGSGTAAVVLCGFTLITSFMAGLIIPAEILPEAMTRIAPLFPIYHVRELVTMLSGGYAPDASLAGAAVQSALWLAAGALMWSREAGRS